jgi:predicted glycosyltransferase
MRAPRILFYAVNGLGLGHVTRMLALARAVRRQSPAAEILFLTSSEAAHIVYREGFAALKLPSRNAARSGGLRHSSWLRLMQSVTLNAATAFDPHILIVDSFAAGTTQELLPILRWPLRKVFVFRAQRPERAADPLFQTTLRHYDLILVPHEKGSEEIPLPSEVEVVWTGPMLIRDRSELLSREDARTALELPSDAEVALLTLGGGGEPTTIAARRLFFEAAHLAVNRALWIETSGPLSGALQYNDGGNGGVENDGDATANPAVRRLRDVQPLMPYLNAFDYAVSAAGYNTVHELQAAHVPAILWPFARDLDDQASRTAALARAGRAIEMGEGVGIGIGGENTGSETKNETAEAVVRRDELTTALCQIALPEVRDRLRTAMANAQTVNGTGCGADAVLKLLP